MMSWFLSPNVILSGLIIAGIGSLLAHNAFLRNELNKVSVRTMEVNSKIVSTRAYDEAQMEAEAERAKVVDKEVGEGITQQCILTEETASLLARVR